MRNFKEKLVKKLDDPIFATCAVITLFLGLLGWIVAIVSSKGTALILIPVAYFLSEMLRGDGQ